MSDHATAHSPGEENISRELPPSLTDADGTEVLLIGGRSGVGKTTTALAAHELLKERDIRHAVIEGDYMDLAHPAPHLEFPTADLALRNLRALSSTSSFDNWLRAQGQDR